MLSLHMLKTARRLYGYTQEELAQKAGKAQRYYTQIENGSSKSAPLLRKLSGILKLRESYLGSLDEYEYIDYPFLADFYQFCIADKNLGEMYRNIVRDICSKSAFVDVIFLLVNPSLIGVKTAPGAYPVMYIAIKDDRDTVFLFKRRLKTRGYARASALTMSDITADNSSLDVSQKLSGKKLVTNTFFRIDYFREALRSMQGTYVYELTKMAHGDLYNRIEEGTVTREEIARLFPGLDFFEGMYQAHTRIKKR